jgi:DNA-binding NtrC family response regulator
LNSAWAFNVTYVKTILVVDNDLGFAFWLGQALDQTGDEAWPARSIPDAIQLISELRLAVDLVVVNASLPSVPLFFANLRESHPHVKIVAVYEESRAVPAVLDADITLCKRDGVDAAARQEWMDAIRSVLKASAASQS